MSPAGIEPATHSLEGCCSIRLSYEDETGREIGRGDRIRTYDPLVPNQVRYQTALHPDANLTQQRLRRRRFLRRPDHVEIASDCSGAIDASGGQGGFPLPRRWKVEREFEDVIVGADAQHFSGHRVAGGRLVVVLDFLDEC